MENITELQPYLDGIKFDDQIVCQLQTEHPEQSRWKVIERLIQGKKVVHMGCLDHIPLIESRIKNNEWLHSLITEKSEKCIGIDINREGIDLVTNDLNVDNVIYGDITGDLIPEIMNDDWDYIILGELLEHIDNPVEFLQSIKEKYSGKIDKIIITVPHAFSKTNFDNAKNGLEVINTDHRFWFTPYTIAKLMTESNIKFESTTFVNCSKLDFLERVKYRINKLIKKENKFKFYYFQGLVSQGKL